MDHFIDPIWDICAFVCSVDVMEGIGLNVSLCSVQAIISMSICCPVNFTFP